MQVALEISFRNLQCIIANIQGVTSESPRLKKVSAVLLKRHPLLQLFLYHATPYTPHCAFYLTHSFYRTPPLLSHALLLPNTTPFISRTPFTERHPFYLTHSFYRTPPFLSHAAPCTHTAPKRKIRTCKNKYGFSSAKFELFTLFNTPLKIARYRT